MKIKRHELATVINRHLSGAEPFDAKQIAAYLMSSGRERELDSLVRDIMSVRADTGIVELTAISAHRLDAEALKRVEAVVKSIRPEAKEVVINQEIRPSLIGGIRLKMVHHELDLSLRGRLNQLKRNLI
ncbi:MAG TPA: F0F1 ATP synthase subunit delta [Candidatus Saccharimonadales bacterium]|nr:F0F1 ATP synthase subunit delta [Candidatus Saccharimonadales bacterium]